MLKPKYLYDVKYKEYYKIPYDLDYITYLENNEKVKIGKIKILGTKFFGLVIKFTVIEDMDVSFQREKIIKIDIEQLLKDEEGFLWCMHGLVIKNKVGKFNDNNNNYNTKYNSFGLVVYTKPESFDKIYLILKKVYPTFYKDKIPIQICTFN